MMTMMILTIVVMRMRPRTMWTTLSLELPRPILSLAPDLQKKMNLKNRILRSGRNAARD